jgi:Flp pilus assembly protein protease CpaA
MPSLSTERFGHVVGLGCWAFAVAALAAAGVIDLRTHRIPNTLLRAAIGCTLIGAALAGRSIVVAAALGGAAAAGPMIAVRLVRRIGAGDIKMAAALGVVGAWVHPLVGLAGVTVASIAAPATAVITGRRAMPLGLWLWLGAALITVLHLQARVLDRVGAR